MNRNDPNMSPFYQQKKLTETELARLGISLDNFNKVNSLEELVKNPPNIVIAKCKKRINFTQNNFTQQTLYKKKSYVMSSGVYMQLHFDTNANIQLLIPSKVQFKNVYKKYNGQKLDNKTLLVFRQGGIGDLLFIQPNLSYLKQKYPTCTIKFACGPQYQSMVKEWKCVDEVLDLPFATEELFNANFHCVFEGVIERCLEAENTCAYNLFSKWMGLNLPDEQLIPKQKPNKTSIEKTKEVLKEFGVEEKDFIVFQLRASSPIRTPNPKVFSDLINTLTEKGHKILITDTPQTSNMIATFISVLKDKDKVFNFSKYSNTIGDTIALTSLAKLVVSTDSSLGHIAISVGTKMFGIYGPFPGKIRLATYPKDMCDWIDVGSDQECSPCFQHGSQPCKNASRSPYSPCYNSLDYNLCIEKIERLLNV